MPYGRTATRGPGRERAGMRRRGFAAWRSGGWAHEVEQWLHPNLNFPAREAGLAAARRPDAARDARGVGGPAAPAGAGQASAPPAGGPQPAFDVALGSAGHGQDDARTAGRADLRRGVRRALSGAGRRQGCAGRGRTGPGPKRDGPPTVLFLDEVHRFNKSQQDAFLPFVEDGTLMLHRRNHREPAFALNNALLSRARVYVLRRSPPTTWRAYCDARSSTRRRTGQISESIRKRWRPCRAAPTATRDAR